jgi:hypothetical protein
VPEVVRTIVELARTLPRSPSVTGRPDVHTRERRGRPRILVVSPHGLVRNIPDVFTELLSAGAELVFSGRRVDRLRIPREIREHANVTLAQLPLVEERDAPAGAQVVRALRDALRFLDSQLEDAAWPRERAVRRFLKLVGHPDWKAATRELTAVRLPHEVCATLESALRGIERALPPSDALVDAAGELEPDALLLVTRCTLDSFEADVVKAARSLGIPSLMLVWSWDNLSSKAVVHEHPDHVLVWNDVQANEAVELQ